MANRLINIPLKKLRLRIDESERYIEQKVIELIKIYSRSQKRLQSMVQDVQTTEWQSWRAQEILSQLKQEINFLNNGSITWAKEASKGGYSRGVNISVISLKNYNIPAKVDMGSLINRQALNVLADSIAVDLMSANSSISRNIKTVILRTQQRLIEDKIITQRIAEGVIEGQARRTTSDAILNDLRKHLNNDEFIKINGRYYEPKYYSELVARTRTREAMTQGIINTNLEYGNDLVQWIAISTACEDCMPLNGVVYSISGKNADFPALKNMPPLHPNCKCILAPITEEGMIYKGNYGALSRLSKEAVA